MKKDLAGFQVIDVEIAGRLEIGDLFPDQEQILAEGRMHGVIPDTGHGFSKPRGAVYQFHP
jgi:hypothetical protein